MTETYVSVINTTMESSISQSSYISLTADRIIHQRIFLFYLSIAKKLRTEVKVPLVPDLNR